MTRKGIIRCIFSIILIAYLVVGLSVSSRMAARQPFTGLIVNIEEKPGSVPNFVTESQIIRELGDDLPVIDSTALLSIDTHAIENRLDSVINIESVNVARTSKGHITVDVVPMTPVMRVFDAKGRSYYINRSGKRLTANSRYHVDVPVVTGAIDSVFPPTRLLPVIDYVSSDSTLNALTTAFKITRHNHDILLIPAIRGHVVNLGDEHNLPDKMARLLTIYKKVLPLKGWQFYDTISVKFAGQVVATRARKRPPTVMINFDNAAPEEEDINSMLTGDSSSPDVLSQKTNKNANNQ